MCKKVYLSFKRLQITALLLLLALTFISAQSEWNPLIEQQQDFQKNAMMVLGGWGLVNVVSGGIGSFTTTGESKHFHQMNLGWGAINTGIAIAGYLGARSFDLSDPVSMSLLNKNLSMSKAFLFNAGLDVGYVMGGLYLRERAKSATKMPERLKGFGNSVMIQGAFLFTFDLVAYFLNNRITSEIQEATINLGATEHGIGFMMHF